MNGMSFPRLALPSAGYRRRDLSDACPALYAAAPSRPLTLSAESACLHSLRGAECHGVSVYPVLDRIFSLRCCRNGCALVSAFFRRSASGGGAWRLPCGDGCGGADGGGIGGAGSGCRIPTRRCGACGGLAPALPARRALTAPGGEFAFLAACHPCLWSLLCPFPPTRARRALFPAGEGGAQGYFVQEGAPPLASPELNLWLAARKRREAVACEGATELQSRGSGGGTATQAKCKNKSLPLPAGEGGWGDRGRESKLKAGAADNPNRRTPAGQRNAHRSQQEKSKPPP